MEFRNCVFQSELGFCFRTPTRIQNLAKNSECGCPLCATVHPNKSPLKISEKRERGSAWAYPGTAQIFWLPTIISGTGKATDFKFSQYTQRVHRNKSHDKFWGKGAWAYPGTVKNYRVPPITSGTGKATDFKFCQYIQRVHQNKSPLKILEKRERGRIQGLPNFFGYPLLSHERGKLRISKFACTFMASIGTEANEKFCKSSRVRCHELLKFSGRPYVGRIARSSLFSINFKKNCIIQKRHLVPMFGLFGVQSIFRQNELRLMVCNPTMSEF